MKIKYANDKLEEIFTDYNKMKKRISFEWVRSIKKTIDRLESADKFGDFLKLGLGKPERLKGSSKQIIYSVHVDQNVRMIFGLNATNDTVLICSELEIKGVCDYHGSKENWYLS